MSSALRTAKMDLVHVLLLLSTSVFYAGIYLPFVRLGHSIVVSRTTLACTAAYNANRHPECFILANEFYPASNKTSYYNNLGKQQQNT